MCSGMSLASLAIPLMPRKLLSMASSPEEARSPKALPIGWGKLDEALPDAGLPRGAVVELAAPYGLARASSIALAACASAQAEAQLRGGVETAGAWCAWLDPSLTLFAPAVARAGVDLERLLIVQPPLEDVARVAVKVASSGVFAVVVVDLAGVPGKRATLRLDRFANSVRRLAMAVEESETTVVLLTDAHAPRATPLPVALRIEVDRAVEDVLMVRIAKDRRGRVAPATAIALPGATAAPDPRRKSA
jgi:recombination protein RecA